MIPSKTTPTIEHRWHPRRPVQFDLALKTINEKTFLGCARDVSPDGIYVQFDNEQSCVHPGCGVELDFSAKVGDAPINHYRVTGVIVHCDQSGAGIMFAACERPLAELLDILVNSD